MFRFTSLNSDLSNVIANLNNKQNKLKFKVIWADIDATNFDGNIGYYIGYVGLNSFSGYISNALCNIPYGCHVRNYGYGTCSIEIRDDIVYISSTAAKTYSVGILQIYT